MISNFHIQIHNEVGTRSYKYTGRSNAAWVRIKKRFTDLLPGVEGFGRFPRPPGWFFLAATHLWFFSFWWPSGSNSMKTVSYGRQRLKNPNIWSVDGENDCMLNLKLTLSIGETIGNCFSPNCSPLVTGNLKITTFSGQEKSFTICLREPRLRWISRCIYNSGHLLH